MSFLFLFAFGTGEASCLCSDDDACRAEIVVPDGSQKVRLSDQESRQAALTDKSLSDSSQQDCCLDCFKTIAMLTASIDSDNFDLQIGSEFVPAFQIAELGDIIPQHYCTRAPPDEHGPGNKVYLAKRVLLI